MRIPDGWFDYSSINKPIENVPIISFKTPLSESYHRPEGCTSEDVFVEEDQEFTAAHLVKKVEDIGFELIVVIDLTFTFRYYNGQMDLEDEFDVQYDKVKCAGQQVPNDEVVFRVAKILNDVISEQGLDSKKLVGIHCTHGVNRTGYIIARYLIEWLNYEPEKAIEAVGKARGHPIEREPFLEDLKKRKPKNGFELWKKGEDFLTDEVSSQDDGFITNTDFAQNADTDRTVDRNWSQYNNDSYSNPRHNRRRDGYKDRYTPYDNYQPRRRDRYNDRYHDNNYSSRSRRNEDGEDFKSDTFDSTSDNRYNAPPPPRW